MKPSPLPNTLYFRFIHTVAPILRPFRFVLGLSRRTKRPLDVLLDL